MNVLDAVALVYLLDLFRGQQRSAHRHSVALPLNVDSDHFPVRNARGYYSHLGCQALAHDVGARHDMLAAPNVDLVRRQHKRVAVQQLQVREVWTAVVIKEQHFRLRAYESNAVDLTLAADDEDILLLGHDFFPVLLQTRILVDQRASHLLLILLAAACDLRNVLKSKLLENVSGRHVEIT